MAHLLAHLASEATPVRVKGDVEYLINRTARGWVVTLFNDNGVLTETPGLHADGSLLCPIIGANPAG